MTTVAGVYWLGDVMVTAWYPPWVRTKVVAGWDANGPIGEAGDEECDNDDAAGVALG